MRTLLDTNENRNFYQLKFVCIDQCLKLDSLVIPALGQVTDLYFTIEYWLKPLIYFSIDIDQFSVLQIFWLFLLILM